MKNIFAGQMSGMENLFCRIVTLLDEINILQIFNGSMEWYAAVMEGDK